MTEPPGDRPADRPRLPDQEATRPADGAAGLRPGRVLGSRYRVERRLGQGGMGEVWHAYDLKLCVEVALKAVLAEHGSERWREQLRREVRAAREVVSPHVCRVFDLVELDDHEYISMEYLDGTTLREHLARPGSLGRQQAGQIAAQLLAGLQAIHDAGLVHRDLKPENVMITRTGRVVLMDFGIARALAETGHGTVAGTPAYMAPEQARGEAVDARADIYAAGLILAELSADRSAEDAQGGDVVDGAEILRRMRQDPPQPPPGPWCDALRRVAAWQPADRFASARSFARALGRLLLETEGYRERCPYPGLSSFTEEHADLFFGREADIEAVGRKLQRLHLLAVVGPSGVGKSSFLRAGVMATLPPGWDCVYCTPGTAPTVALGQALVPRLAGDTDALRSLLRFGEVDVALSMFARWRRRHAQALLIVDQFEELFTQNPPEVQAGFAELLGRLPLEADVKVLIGIRDDFLFHCQAHAGLRSIFVELTPLAPLRGSELRRALVEPALACGYQFESEAMVDRMVAEVESERGALPLLAFTAARLWDRRDRERRLLPGEAYAELGGVAGSLAQHAEATLERIGEQRQAMVREIFRNLVTARGTRISCEREALLGLFADREAAAEVLTQLIEARLLTTFEAADPAEPVRRQQRVEVIHESLLTAWPRLVRWQTQDVDGAQLRDQLRQAAQLWEERNRPEDLLWTGTVYQEYRLWRDRYPGGLTGSEEAYATAMVVRANRRRRRRQFAVTGGFAALMVVVAIFGALWRRSVEEYRRAESTKLYTLAVNEPLTPHALAYALAALELSDQPEYRRLAFERALQAPLPIQLPIVPNSHNPWSVAFSPDGAWMAVGWAMQGSLQLHELASGEIRLLQGHRHRLQQCAFTADSAVLITTALDSTFRLWDVRQGSLLRTNARSTAAILPFPLPDPDRFLVCEGREGEPLLWSVWTVRDGEETVLGHTGEAHTGSSFMNALSPDVDAAGRWIALPRDRDVWLYRLADLSSAPLRLRNDGDRPIVGVSFSPDGMFLAAWTGDGTVAIWSSAGGSWQPWRTLKGGDGVIGVHFDSSGELMTVAGETDMRLFDLQSPGSAPLVFGAKQWTFRGIFHPAGDWLVSAGTAGEIKAWPLNGRHPVTLAGHDGGHALVFAPDGSWLATASYDGTIEWWPLDGRRVGAPRVLFETPGYRFQGISTDAGGGRLFAFVGNSREGEGTMVVIDLVDGRLETRIEPGVAYADAGGDHLVFLAESTGGRRPRFVNVATGATTTFGSMSDRPLGFDRAGRVLAVSRDSLFAWEHTSGQRRLLAVGMSGAVELCPDRRRLLVLDPQGRLSVRRTDGSVDRILLENLDRGIYLGASAAEPDSLVVLTLRNGIEVLDTPSGRRWRLPIQGWDLDRLAVDPRGRWVAAMMPGRTQLFDPRNGMPVPDLPREELLARLHRMTNYRAVPSRSNISGYTVQGSGVPEWNHPPRW